MSSRNSGDKLVSDLTRAILFVVKQSSKITLNSIVSLLGDKYDGQLVRNRAYYLRYSKSLTGSSRSGLSITPKGRTALVQLELEIIDPPKTWDKKWRVVIYDIPESKRSARNQIRQLLKGLGFRQLQISVWAHPLPCYKQFQAIRKAYGIEKHLLFLEVNHCREFRALLIIFAKQYPMLRKSH